MFDTKIPVYAIAILLSLIINIVVVILIYKKHEFSKHEIIGAIVYENIGVILGAKIFNIFQNYKLNRSFDLLSAGLSSYGAVIGAIIWLIIFSLQFKKPLKNMLFTFMPSIPVMYAIGKIGCFLAGCCHGIKYNGWGSVVYNYSPAVPANINFFPVQIAETIVFTLIFIYMIAASLKNKFDMKTLGISFILCGFGKFILDYLRMSHTGKLISLNQIISIIFIIIGAAIIYIHQKRDYFHRNHVKT